MRHPFFLFISFRYINYKYVNYTSRFNIFNTLTAISIGISILVVILSITNGFHYEIKQELLKNTPHITINNFSKNSINNWSYILNKIKNKEGISEIIPRVCFPGLILKKQTYNIYINGISIKKNKLITYNLNIIEGSIKEIKKNSHNIAIGYNLAKNLDVWINDVLSIIVFSKNSSMIGYEPKILYFKIKAIFNLNHILNNSQIFLNIFDLKKIFDTTDGIKQINIKLYNAMQSNIIAKNLNVILNGKFKINTWININNDIFNTIKMEKSVVDILIILIIILISINLLSNLYILVINKKFDIAILKIIGASREEITIIFVIIGVIIGVVGTTIGIILGIFLSYNISDIFNIIQNIINIKINSLFNCNIIIPYQVEFNDLIYIFISSFFICCISTLYPAYSVYYMKPNKILNEY